MGVDRIGQRPVGLCCGRQSCRALCLGAGSALAKMHRGGRSAKDLDDAAYRPRVSGNRRFRRRLGDVLLNGRVSGDAESTRRSDGQGEHGLGDGSITAIVLQGHRRVLSAFQFFYSYITEQVHDIAKQ